MKFRVICQRCESPLTHWLKPVDEDFLVTWPDADNIIPQGHYWVADEDLGRIMGHIVIHLDDLRGLREHPDPDGSRFTGCCGPSAGKVNLLCGCGEEVATEVADCWTGHYAHFEPGTTKLQAFPPEMA